MKIGKFNIGKIANGIQIFWIVIIIIAIYLLFANKEQFASLVNGEDDCSNNPGNYTPYPKMFIQKILSPFKSKKPFKGTGGYYIPQEYSAEPSLEYNPQGY